jgi:hypothetical protein|nr:MAG TPA: Putative virion structural protein [Bacteriophage sp.]
MGQYRTKNKVKVRKPVPTQKATTITEFGPNDSLARVDGYGQTSSTIPTDFYSAISKYSDSFFDSYTSGGLLNGEKTFNLKSLKGLVQFGNKIAEFDLDKIKKRVEDTVLGGRSIESILNLPEQFKNDALGTIAGLAGNTSIAGRNVGEILRKTQMTYRDAMGVYNLVKRGDWTTFSGIVNSLGAFTNATTNSNLGELLKGYVDIQATSAFLGSLVKTASKLGNASLTKMIMDKFQDKREGRRYLNATLYNCCLNSDLPTIDYIFDYAGDQASHGNNPMAVKWLLENYNRDGLYTPDKVGEYRQRLIDILNRADPQWYYTYQNGTKITRLDAFQGISKDARSLLSFLENKTEHDFTTELMIANHYPEQDMKQMVMRMYEDITFKDRPLDPRYKR